MTNAALKAVADKEFTTERPGKYKLDELDAGRVARNLLLFRPSEQAVEHLMTSARRSIPTLAATEDVLRVLRHNPACMFAVARKSKFSPETPSGEGFIAILPLNELGMQLLALGSLNTAKPDVKFIARPHERPAGIYLWCVFAPGPLAAGMALFLKEMEAPLYAGINLYARSITEAGRRFSEVLGFQEGVTVNGHHAPDLWVFTREHEKPIYDSYSLNAAPGEIGITLARTFEDLIRVASIRSAVYIGEQRCPC